MVGEHAAAQATLLAAKHVDPARKAMRDHQGHAANRWANSATMAPTRIIAGAKAIDKPCPSLVLAASSGSLVMAFGRRLYALQTHKATRVTHMCTVLYEFE